MSEQLIREQRRQLIEILLKVPIVTGTATDRQSLLTGIPTNLWPDCEGNAGTFVNRAVSHFERVGILDSGEAALAIFVENIWETVRGCEVGHKLEDFLGILGAGEARRVELRRAYAKHLREKYEPANLRGLVPAEYARLHNARVMLRDIYVPLTATVVERRPAPAYTEVLVERLETLGEAEWTGADFTDEARREAERRAGRVPRKAAREQVPLNTLAVNEKVVVVLGDPGSGKSTFLKQHALALLQEEDGPLPIMVPLAAYAQALQDQAALGIIDFSVQYYEANEVPSLRPLFTHARRHGQAIYLLDGLDEVPSEWRGQVSDKVVALARNIGENNTVVATSRITGYIPLPLDTYTEATVEPFSEEQIAEFVHKWYTAFFGQQGQMGETQKTAAGLLRVVKENRGVAKLADNPLTVTMLTLLYYAGNADLPRQRIKLYGQVAKTLIEDWRKARSLAAMPVGSSHEELEVLKRIGPLAYWMHDQKPEGLASRSEIEHQLVKIELKANNGVNEEDPLPSLRKFLDQVRGDMGLLSERGPDQWSFTHLTFEEYFAAREIARRPMKMASEIRKRAPDPRWTEVIRLAIAYLEGRL